MCWIFHKYVTMYARGLIAYQECLSCKKRQAINLFELSYIEREQLHKMKLQFYPRELTNGQIIKQIDEEWLSEHKKVKGEVSDGNLSMIKYEQGW